MISIYIVAYIIYLCARFNVMTVQCKKNISSWGETRIIDNFFYASRSVSGLGLYSDAHDLRSDDVVLCPSMYSVNKQVNKHAKIFL